MLRAYKKVPITGTTIAELARQLNVTADKLSETLGPILANADLDKATILNVALVAATPKAVNHGLQRQPRGWRVVDVIGGALAIQRTAWDPRTITLQNANNITAAVEVW